MTFNPRELYDPGTYQTTAGIVSIEPNVEINGYLVTFITDIPEFKFSSVHHVFACVRTELIRNNDPGFLIMNSARYAISYDRLKIPSLFNPVRNVFLFDPLLPYRNPVIELYQGRAITLVRALAKPHYFAPGAILQTPLMHRVPRL